jgi:hypothetical protein
MNTLASDFERMKQLLDRKSIDSRPRRSATWLRPALTPCVGEDLGFGRPLKLKEGVVD